MKKPRWAVLVLIGVLARAGPAAAGPFCDQFQKRYAEQNKDPEFLYWIYQARYGPRPEDKQAAAKQVLVALNIPQSPEALPLAQELVGSGGACMWWGYDLISYLALVQVRDDASKRALLKGLKHEHAGTRRVVMKALGTFPEEDLISSLFEVFKNDPDMESKHVAACTLSYTGNYSTARRTKMIRFFSSVMDSPKVDPAVKELASKAIRNITGRGADKGFQRECFSMPTELIGYCDDFLDLYRKRWQASESFQKSLTRMLDLAYNSSDFQERAAAGSSIMAALSIPESKKGLAFARLLIYSLQPWCMNWGYQLISYLDMVQVRDAASKSDLARGLEDRDPAIRTSVVMALGAYSDEDMIPMIYKTFRDDPDQGVRERAACSLSHTGIYTKAQRLRMIPFFISFLEDPSLNAQTRDWAAQALHYVTGESFGRSAESWREWQRENRHSGASP